MTTVIAIGNLKGGVAKTTTCLSLGGCLAEMGKIVLLLDLDPQAHLTLSLGLKPENIRYTVSEVLLGNLSLVGASRETGTFGLDIVPANQSLSVVNKVLYRQAGYEFLLKQQIHALKDSLYDVILIDCPPACGPLTLNALTAADLLVIPLLCDYYAARSLRQTIGMAKLVRERTNPSLEYRILITMYDRRIRLSHLVLEQLQQQLGHRVLQTIIEVDARLKESGVAGNPINRYAPKSRGAHQYRLLATELLSGHVTAVPTSRESPMSL
ncbi:MAG: AAA family ATPase [Anaerolineae bacterium]|nr:AAA family ATPase [Anaerolineae bacterium]